MRNRFLTITILACITFYFVSCTNDKLVPVVNDCSAETPVWEEEVEGIVELTCAYSGCHVSGSGAPGNYLSYSGISSILRNGSFKNRVFDIKDNPTLGMPPEDAAGPKELTEDQLLTLSCWMEAGFPEN